MSKIDYDEPANEEQWCDARRQDVIDYLGRQAVRHGEVGEWPAWHIAPYVSIWAIESCTAPGWVGWWAICGDLPTDYVSAAEIKHPREAVRAIAQRWRDASQFMARGEAHPTITIGSPAEWPELAPMLRSRAGILHEWAEDDDLWDDDL